MADIFKVFLEKRKAKIKERQSFAEVPLVPFDEVDMEGTFEGKCNKEFTRCLGWYLMDMVKEIRKNPQTNYVTCVDTVINRPDFKEEDFEKFGVSVILKTPFIKNIKAAKNELMGSRVAEIMGVKTEYVAPIKNNSNRYLAVDFLTGDQEMVTFKDFVEKDHINTYLFNEGSCCIKHWIDPLINAVMKKSPIKSPLRKMMSCEPILTDLVKLYILKKYIIHDADFCTLNTGVIYSPGYKNLHIAPAFDFEQAFMPGMRTAQGHGLEEDLDYLAKNYPTILEKVVQQFTLTDKKKSKIKDVFSTFEESVDMQKELFNLVNNSLISFQGYAKKAFEKYPRRQKKRSASSSKNEESVKEN